MPTGDSSILREIKLGFCAAEIDCWNKEQIPQVCAIKEVGWFTKFCTILLISFKKSTLRIGIWVCGIVMKVLIIRPHLFWAVNVHICQDKSLLPQNPPACTHFFPHACNLAGHPTNTPSQPGYARSRHQGDFCPPSITILTLAGSEVFARCWGSIRKNCAYFSSRKGYSRGTPNPFCKSLQKISAEQEESRSIIKKMASVGMRHKTIYHFVA